MNDELYMKVLATVVCGGILFSLLAGAVCALMGVPPFPMIAILVATFAIEISMILYGVWRVF